MRQKRWVNIWMAKKGTYRDLTNIRSGRLVAIKFHSRDKWGNAKWECKCDCGNTVVVLGTSIYVSRTKSCGCLIKENGHIQSAKLATHGMTRTPAWNRWINMISRCYVKTSSNYHYYGGRGIKVCDRWRHSFENFYADMGDPPTKNHSLERLRVNDNYEPGNCEWVTFDVQVRNRRDNNYQTYNGVTMCVTDWAKIFQAGPSAVSSHLGYKSMNETVDFYVKKGTIEIIDGQVIPKAIAQ